MASKFVLLQLRLPTGDDFHSGRARVSIGDAIGQSRPSEGVEQLGEDVWLIDLRPNLPLLGRICSAADSAEVPVPYRLMFLEQPPEWITCGKWK